MELRTSALLSEHLISPTVEPNLPSKSDPPASASSVYPTSMSHHSWLFDIFARNFYYIILVHLYST